MIIINPESPLAVAGIPLAVMYGLAMVVLLGPVARRLAGERRPFSEEERASLTMTERVDAVNNVRGMLLQSVTALLIIGGLLFTAQGVVYTAQTVEATQQGQITDRYTKTIEQLASDKLSARLGGVYALERLARDSERDRRSIYDVLAAFVRERASLAGAKSSTAALAVDAEAALVVLARREIDEEYLEGIVDDQGNIFLHEGSLPVLNLSDVRLRGVDLAVTVLGGFNGVDFRRVNFAGSDLSGANFRDVVLRGANLAGANLAGTDLRGADLREVSGVTDEQIKAVAKVDEKTLFGVCPEDTGCGPQIFR
ncbi:hypothetical protein Misp01_23550 [Microtetraspora sp. NBRC 13810]|uniref:pentapeptide repeat-containing protein n=1 Tax=Microtetraspora sp. NBRC 13810 TaxID=3030990 RepID=UPI0024A57FEA|nr:pentapeptide repeat-containing protein [Microtetraspora sp. NBRC 13810]GLW07225.1 hypothetical protein Misp01_23550 [Microtetraspora sp. NBRC 13810]